MYRIAKRFSFDAAHHLPSLPDGHKCKRPHGHTYSVEIQLRETIGLNEHAFVLDYGKLDVIKKWIDETLDHRDLNEVFSNGDSQTMSTTAENLARYLYGKFFGLLTDALSGTGVILYGVKVSETPNTWAEYRNKP